MHREAFKKYMPTVIVILFGILCFIIIRPFITSILTSLVIVFVFYPLYQKLKQQLKNDTLSALLMCLFILIIIVLPIIFLTTSVISEAPTVIQKLRRALNPSGTLLSDVNAVIYEHFGMEVDFSQSVNQFITSAVQLTQKIILSLPSTFANLFVIFFFMYYFFKDGKMIFNNLKKFMPYDKKHRNNLIKKIKLTTGAILYGHTVTAVIQGILAAVGYSLFGISGAVYLGIITIFLTVLPIGGPALLYIPISGFLIITNLQTQNILGLLSGIGLLAYGTFVISGIDNVVKPKIIGSHANIHPLVIITGVLGGIGLFGFIGFVFGPLIFAVFLEVMKEYQLD